ncbi:MAG: transposase [Symploca sp. SIO2E9]|nr:transposase [Symploca sp. SIO2E9]
MVWRFSVTYYYVSPQNAERIDAFRELSGDSEKGLITQFVRGWIGINRKYYLDLAKKDASARDISFKQWGETVVKEGIEFLPRYNHEIKDIPPNPLRDVALSPDVIRKGINYISLGTQNLALLRVGIHYDRDNAIGFVSRIVKEHLDRNWDRLYASQVEAENFENWQ